MIHCLVQLHCVLDFSVYFFFCGELQSVVGNSSLRMEGSEAQPYYRKCQKNYLHEDFSP